MGNTCNWMTEDLAAEDPPPQQTDECELIVQEKVSESTEVRLNEIRPL